METKTIKTKIHYYYYDISKPDQREQYMALKKDLSAQGLILFDVISGTSYDQKKAYNEKIQALTLKGVKLETEHLFNNQWNTAPLKKGENGLRIFDWTEEIYPNKSIKEGHYLEQTNEMKAIREHTYKCGYCGKNYFKPDHSFCTSDRCLGSEYLTEKDYPLLFLVPIASEDRYSRKDVIVPDSLVKRIKVLQKKTRTAKLKADQARKLKEIKNKIEASKKELKAFKWLIDQNLDYDNVIYYNHTDTFSFGWRNTLDENQKAKLKKVLTKFPYKWEFSKR